MHALHRRLALAIAALLGLTLLTIAMAPADSSSRLPLAGLDVPQAADSKAKDAKPQRPKPRSNVAAPRRSVRKHPPRDISVYRGLGTWIDMYDDLPYRRPRLVIADIASRGVKTIYLQTANYNRPVSRTRHVYAPAYVGTMLEAAHRRGIKVVAWTLPGFRPTTEDFQRARAAIRFRSANGHRFDGFALDIEAYLVDDLDVRNRRLGALSRRLRATVRPDYALGAILPEANASYWADFPYDVVARHYDVFLPMAYYSFRTEGYRNVRRWLGRNIREIRAETGRRSAPVHVIGGVSEGSSDREVRALVDEAHHRKAVGASMYSWRDATPGHWGELKRLRKPEHPRAKDD